ncbi:stress responsive protein [Tamlana sedimentorum]|uniref:Stress responsive protein n=1 Tax=Neotamlana sedimentorum TaxID=1435349 RepID=A0A0D7WAE9_9FLAO|nr:Dabb family protein [Tamlana sedimentorum]KJD36140.1 stress responsive protein [Tamlana sedimentorum]
MEQKEFKHTVFFWLKNPDNKKDRDVFETSLFYFIKNSKFIKTKHIGIPAQTNREVIDSSYTYSLSLSFNNKEDHDKYQNESNHHKFLEECSKLWTKVVVYDSINIL